MKVPFVVSQSGVIAAISLMACFYSTVLPAQSVDPVNRHRDQRILFVDAQEALRYGDIIAAQEKLAAMTDYPLYHYLDYLLLRQRIARSDEPVFFLKKVQSFRERSGDDRSHRRLLGVIKGRLAKLEKWSDYAQLTGLDNTPVHPCDDLFSRVKSGSLTKFDQSAGTLWVDFRRHTDNCDSAFSKLIDAGDVPTSALWQRTVALLIKGRYSQVKQLLPFYSQRDRSVIESWLADINQPHKLLEKGVDDGSMKYHPKLASRLLKRWLRDDLLAANEFWQRHGESFGFNKKDISKATSRHAVLAAKRNMPEAADLLAQVQTDDRAVQRWRVRLALRSGNWRDVLSALDQLTEKDRMSTRFSYWRARALQELGFEAGARRIFKQLANKFDYFGFLAADRLSTGYGISAQNPAVDSLELNKLSNMPVVKRAIEYFLVGLAWEGRREWNKALENASDKTLFAAAELALSVGWYDRAYASIRKAGQPRALRYHFPTPHNRHIKNLVANSPVDESLVYGVMRQESGFIADVKSPAGAVGLMQLMPATAKEMAATLKVSARTSALIDGETNIQLGVGYLDFVLNKFKGNPVLAIAAYNAGPSRVAQWTKEISMDTDIWVETIPFDETRGYVQGVLFNTIVSQWRLHGRVPTRLADLMQPVITTQ